MSWLEGPIDMGIERLLDESVELQLEAWLRKWARSC